MSGGMARAAVLAVALALASSSLPVAQETTLRDVLREAGIRPRPAVPRGLLDLRLSNGADVSTDREYFYAGWSLVSGRFDTLHVVAVDRESGAWRHGGFKEDPNGSVSLLGGSVVDMRASPHFLTLELHHNPSAGTTWVLGRDLSRAGTFYGWTKELLPNELMVYEHSEIHFAPTHYVEISIYDPFARNSTQIYPIPGGTAVRRAFVAAARARWTSLGEDWFRTHNHHGNPELFDSASGRFAVDWTAGGMAFEVRYDDFTGTDGGTSAATERIIVSCDGLTRAMTARCGESLEKAWADALPARDAEARLREAAARPRLVPWR